MGALTAALITVNWGIYVWAIAADRAVETALGYYINPLISVVMGAVFLGEKLSRAQMVAIGLAVLAVLILTVGNRRPALDFAGAGDLLRHLRLSRRRCRSGRARASSSKSCC